MGILQRIMDALGLHQSDDAERERSAGPAVRVERERADGANEPDPGDEPGRPSPGADAEEGVEPAEAAGPADDEPAAADVVSEEHADEPVEAVKGIGPAYAERLGDAGVATVGQLAAADADSLAAATDISEKRIDRWIERARAR